MTAASVEFRVYEGQLLACFGLHFRFQPSILDGFIVDKISEGLTGEQVGPEAKGDATLRCYCPIV
jgi:hypothetical protein